VYNAQPVGRLRRISGGVDTRVASSFQGQLLQKQLTGEFGLTTLNLWNFAANTRRPPAAATTSTRPAAASPTRSRCTGGPASTSPHRTTAGSSPPSTAPTASRTAPGPDLALELRLRPVNRLELTLRGDFNATYNRPRWTTTNALDEPVFARAKVNSYTGVLRGTLGILPNLTLQSFNQLYYLSAHHDRLLHPDRAERAAPTDPPPRTTASGRPGPVELHLEHDPALGVPARQLPVRRLHPPHHVQRGRHGRSIPPRRRAAGDLDSDGADEILTLGSGTCPRAAAIQAEALLR
jgi:hypothetical protein